MAKKKGGSASKNGASLSPAAYFLSLSLESVRGFREKQTLELFKGKGAPAQVTILLGNSSSS
jgi:hypothetical protein